MASWFTRLSGRDTIRMSAPGNLSTTSLVARKCSTSLMPTTGKIKQKTPPGPEILPLKKLHPSPIKSSINLLKAKWKASPISRGVMMSSGRKTSNSRSSKGHGTLKEGLLLCRDPWQGKIWKDRTLAMALPHRSWHTKSKTSKTWTKNRRLRPRSK